MEDDTIELEKKYVLQTYSRPDFVLDRGEGVYLYDTAGRKYLDFVAGIAVNNLGYSHGEILRAISEQAGQLIHVSNLYHTRPHVELARALVEASFADRAFFCNSGTEAMEAALKFARKWAKENGSPERYEFVAFAGSFHGRTFGALSLTHREKYRTPFEPLVPGARFATFNDLASADSCIGPHTCAVVVEPVQGEGGVNLADAGFLEGLRRLCDERGALLIFDEVQCGLGRTGYLFAHEYYGVYPDIMALAKPLGGGLPIGATLMTQRVADAMHPGDHASTFGANALICSVAKVVFNRLRDPSFLASIREKGEYTMENLRELGADCSLVKEVRGRGLIIGLELTVEAGPVVKEAQGRGLLIATAGEKVVRFVPPLVVEKEHLDYAVETVGDILKGMERSGG